jgi:hypothetical protein
VTSRGGYGFNTLHTLCSQKGCEENRICTEFRMPEESLSACGECWMLYEVDWIMVLLYLL